MQPRIVQTCALWCAMLGPLVAALASTPMPSFDAYQIILDRKPFGVEPPPPPAPEVPFNPAESFAAKLRMSAIIHEPDEGIFKVGLIDNSNGQSFFISAGVPENGVELVSADFEKGEAIIQKGAEKAVISLSSGDIKAVAPTQARSGGAPAPNMPPTRMTYEERRAQRLRERQQVQPSAPIEPKYTGEELEKHLKEYQMEVIRQGLPPLPIPLTEEMDQQLVAEGVLPPAE